MELDTNKKCFQFTMNDIGILNGTVVTTSNGSIDIDCRFDALNSFSTDVLKSVEFRYRFCDRLLAALLQVFGFETSEYSRRTIHCLRLRLTNCNQSQSYGDKSSIQDARLRLERIADNVVASMIRGCRSLHVTFSSTLTQWMYYDNMDYQIDMNAIAPERASQTLHTLPRENKLSLCRYIQAASYLQSIRTFGIHIDKLWMYTLLDHIVAEDYWIMQQRAQLPCHLSPAAFAAIVFVNQKRFEEWVLPGDFDSRAWKEVVIQKLAQWEQNYIMNVLMMMTANSVLLLPRDICQMIAGFFPMMIIDDFLSLEFVTCPRIQCISIG